MNSKIQIVNQALVQLGERPIDDFDETKAAIVMATFWPGSVDSVLRGHPWNFATRRQVLARIANAPPFGFGSAFVLPADCVRVLEVMATEYKLEGRCILCDEHSLAVRYVSSAIPITEYDSIFCDALSLYLAWKGAYPITKSNSVAEACWTAYTQLLAQARTVDAQEEPPDDFGESSMINVRG